MQIEEIYNHQHKLSGTPLPIRSLFILPAFVLTMFSSSNIFNASTALLLLILTHLFTKISVGKILRLYTGPLLFVALGCFTLALNFNSSSPFFTNSNIGLGFETENFKHVSIFLTRSMAILCIICFGLLTHTISEISELMRPIRIPTLFIEIFILTYKFIFTLSSISKVMYTAQLSRQAYMCKRNNIKAFSILSSSIFRRAIQQSNHLATAIDVRLGSGNFYFLSKENNFKAKQLWAPIALLLVLIVSFKFLNAHG